MRRTRLVPAAAGLLLCLAMAGIAAAQELPRVRLVATGGTISNREGGRLTADDLVGFVPDVRRFARPESEQFSNTSSSELTLKQWLTLSRRLNELFSADRALAGIVVTSGTDTLEELAYIPCLVGLFTVLWRWYVVRKVGGVTGDAVGAASEMNEALTLLLFVSLLTER